MSVQPVFPSFDFGLASLFSRSNAAKDPRAPALIVIRPATPEFSLEGLEPFLSRLATTCHIVGSVLGKSIDAGHTVRSIREMLGEREVVHVALFGHGRGEGMFIGEGILQIEASDFERINGDVFLIACYSLGFAKKFQHVLANGALRNGPRRIWGTTESIIGSGILFSSGPIYFNLAGRNVFHAISSKGELISHEVPFLETLQEMERRAEEENDEPIYEFLASFFYNRGDYQKAFLWAFKAPKEYNHCLYILGVLSKSKEEKRFYFERAALRGFPTAQFALAELLVGEGKFSQAKEELEKALPYLHHSLQQRAKLLLAMCQKNLGTASPSSLRETFTFLLSKSSEEGPGSFYTLAYCFMCGIGTPENKTAAARCFYDYIVKVDLSWDVDLPNPAIPDCFDKLFHLWYNEGVLEARHCLDRLFADVSLKPKVEFFNLTRPRGALVG